MKVFLSIIIFLSLNAASEASIANDQCVTPESAPICIDNSVYSCFSVGQYCGDTRVTTDPDVDVLFCKLRNDQSSAGNYYLRTQYIPDCADVNNNSQNQQTETQPQSNDLDGDGHDSTTDCDDNNSMVWEPEDSAAVWAGCKVTFDEQENKCALSLSLEESKTLEDCKASGWTPSTTKKYGYPASYTDKSGNKWDYHYETVTTKNGTVGVVTYIKEAPPLGVAITNGLNKLFP